MFTETNTDGRSRTLARNRTCGNPRGLVIGRERKSPYTGLRRAVQQVERNDEVPSGFFVMHQDDWANIELLKDRQGRYIVASPQASTTPQLWGKPVVVTTAMTAGHFLAGSTEAAEVHDRLDATIEVSLDYSDYRARNLATILCEERTVLTVYRPNAFVYGTLNSSPA
jgi:HK97 family phage major capsid protein